MSVNPSNLPAISSAKLPATYERAKTALAECTRIDECQEWADKAEAMASYAKQARDDTLRKMADRIQARAIRRCGELLKQIEPQQGGDRRSTGGSPPVGRKAAAAAAGLSEHQRKTALRVANVPAEDFEQQVEGSAPPTVTQLAEQGKRPLVDLGSTAPADFKLATKALGELRRFTEFAASAEPARVAAGLRSHEAAEIRRYISQADAWLDGLVAHLKD